MTLTRIPGLRLDHQDFNSFKVYYCYTLTRKFNSSWSRPDKVERLITQATLALTDVLREKRDILKAKRNSLFDEYLKCPHNFQLAAEIKPIDDEIAVCTEKMGQEKLCAKAT